MKIVFILANTYSIYLIYKKLLDILTSLNITYIFLVPKKYKNEVKTIFDIKNKDNVVCNLRDINMNDVTHVVYQLCYNCLYEEEKRSYNIKKKYNHITICYYNYGYSFVNHDFLNGVGYNKDFFDFCDVFFLENELNVIHYRERIENKNIKLKAIGCMKMSQIYESLNKPTKKTNKLFYIMWCPRWHTNLNMCSYKKYVNYLIDFINKNENTSLIFRPHPLTNYKYNEIIEASDKNERITIDLSDNYSDKFSYIDCFISDPSSLLAEASGCNIPVIYTITIENVFTEFGEVLQESFYIVKNEEEISNTLYDLINFKDEKKNIRKEIIDKYYKIYNTEKLFIDELNKIN